MHRLATTLMRWYQIEIPGSDTADAGVDAVGLIRELEGKYLAAGAPNFVDIYLFCKTAYESVFYFSPDASRLFRPELKMRNAKRCEPPQDLDALRKITL